MQKTNKKEFRDEKVIKGKRVKIELDLSIYRVKADSNLL